MGAPRPTRGSSPSRRGRLPTCPGWARSAAETSGESARDRTGGDPGAELDLAEHPLGQRFQLPTPRPCREVVVDREGGETDLELDEVHGSVRETSYVEDQCIAAPSYLQHTRRDPLSADQREGVELGLPADLVHDRIVGPVTPEGQPQPIDPHEGGMGGEMDR